MNYQVKDLNSSLVFEHKGISREKDQIPEIMSTVDNYSPNRITRQELHMPFILKLRNEIHNARRIFSKNPINYDEENKSPLIKRNNQPNKSTEFGNIIHPNDRNLKNIRSDSTNKSQMNHYTFDKEFNLHDQMKYKALMSQQIRLNKRRNNKITDK